MRLKVMLLLTVIAMVTVACAGGSFSSAPGDAVMEEKAARQETVYPTAVSAPRAAYDEDTGESTVPTSNGEMERMIIYNGNLDIVVQDTDKAQEDIVSMVDRMEGYVVNVSSYSYGNGLMRIYITVRVPAESFNEAMAFVREMAMEVNSENVSSQDVTEEYVDLESRLRALEVKAERLEELMDEAEDTEAVLAVYRELAATQQEIEQVKGRMRYLERSSAMATLEIQLTPDEVSQPVEIAGWRPQGTIKRAIEQLIKTFQFLADVVMWVVLYILPVLLVVGVVLFVVFKLLGLVLGGRRRKKADKKASSEGDKPTV